MTKGVIGKRISACLKEVQRNSLAGSECVIIGCCETPTDYGFCSNHWDVIPTETKEHARCLYDLFSAKTFDEFMFREAVKLAEKHGIYV